MINQVVAEVMHGQPTCTVIGHSQDFAMNFLLPMVREKLEVTGILCRRIGNTIEWNGSKIYFLSINDSEYFYRMHGIHGSEFYDHYAVGDE